MVPIPTKFFNNVRIQVRIQIRAPPVKILIHSRGLEIGRRLSWIIFRQQGFNVLVIFVYNTPTANYSFFFAFFDIFDRYFSNPLGLMRFFGLYVGQFCALEKAWNLLVMQKILHYYLPDLSCFWGWRKFWCRRMLQFFSNRVLIRLCL